MPASPLSDTNSDVRLTAPTACATLSGAATSNLSTPGMMSDQGDNGDTLYKMNTVPPPPGESDAYSAPTKVGPMSAAVVEEIKVAAKARADARKADRKRPVLQPIAAPVSESPPSSGGTRSARIDPRAEEPSSSPKIPALPPPAPTGLPPIEDLAPPPTPPAPSPPAPPVSPPSPVTAPTTAATTTAKMSPAVLVTPMPSAAPPVSPLSPVLVTPPPSPAFSAPPPAYAGPASSPVATVPSAAPPPFAFPSPVPPADPAAHVGPATRPATPAASLSPRSDLARSPSRKRLGAVIVVGISLCIFVALFAAYVVLIRGVGR